MKPAKYEIGAARPEELTQLPDIEQRACDLFLQIPWTAELPLVPTPLAEFQQAHRSGLLWVARLTAGPPVGFILVEILDGAAHVEELDVLPEHGRKGLGATLVRTVLEWAQGEGLSAVTLTTFREIPWNEPFYRRLGFRVLGEDEIGPQLRERMEEETRAGLPLETRVAMRYDLSSRFRRSLIPFSSGLRVTGQRGSLARSSRPVPSGLRRKGYEQVLLSGRPSLESLFDLSGLRRGCARRVGGPRQSVAR